MEEQKGRIEYKKKVPAEGFSLLLPDLKLVYTAQIPWGTLYTKLFKDYIVIKFAQADAQIVFFMFIVHNNK